MDFLEILKEKCDQFLAASASVPTPSRTRREKKPAIKEEVPPPSTEASNRKKGRKIPANENLKGSSKHQVSAFTASHHTEQPNTTNDKPKSSKKRSKGTGSLDFDRKSTKKKSIDHAQGMLKNSGGKKKRKRSSITERSDGTPAAVASALRTCASVDCPPDPVAMVSQVEEEPPSFSFGNEASLETPDARSSQQKGRRRKIVAIVSSQSIITDDALIVTIPKLMPATVANPNSNPMVATMPVHEIKNPYAIEYSFHQILHRNPAATLAQTPCQELNIRSWFTTQEGNKPNKAYFRRVPIKIFRTIQHGCPLGFLCLKCYSCSQPDKCPLEDILSRLREKEFEDMCTDCIVPNKKTVCCGKDCKKAVQRLAFFRAIREGRGYEKMRTSYIRRGEEAHTYLLDAGAATSDTHDVKKQIRWVFTNWNSFSDTLTAVGADIFSD